MGKHYIDNKEFERIILSYQEDPKTHEDEFVGLIDLLITNIVDSFRFKVPSDDAKQECFLLILKVLNNFNKESGAAFNYFTTVILNNFRLVYTKNKKYDEKLEAYRNARTGGYSPSGFDSED